MDWEKQLLELGADRAAKLYTDKIPFEPSLVELCKMNQCGNYGKCWVCPPYVGETDSLIAKAKAYSEIYVFQKIYHLSDSFDFEGMTKGADDFKKLTNVIFEFCKKNLSDFLMLGAGGCRICEKCAVQDHLPCRFPEKAYPSLESYGIQVSALAKECGLNYINGQNTVTYFGGILI